MAPPERPGSQGPIVDLERRRRLPAALVGATRSPPFRRPGALVALFHGLLLGPQWRCLLRAPIRHRSVASLGTSVVERVSQRAVRRPAISLARLSAPLRVGAIQRPPTAGLLHHRVHRGTAGARDGIAPVAR